MDRLRVNADGIMKIEEIDQRWRQNRLSKGFLEKCCLGLLHVFWITICRTPLSKRFKVSYNYWIKRYVGLFIYVYIIYLFDITILQTSIYNEYFQNISITLTFDGEVG